MSSAHVPNGTIGFPGWSDACQSAQTRRNVGVFPPSSFWIESLILSSNGRVSPHAGSLVSHVRKVKPKYDFPSGGGSSRVLLVRLAEDIAGVPAEALLAANV